MKKGEVIKTNPNHIKKIKMQQSYVIDPPLVMRKYNILFGWPLWIGIVTDKSITDLDQIVNQLHTKYSDDINNDPNSIRNAIEGITRDLNSTYDCFGVAVIAYVDKMFVISSYGTLNDSTSPQFKQLFGLLNIAPHI